VITEGQRISRSSPTLIKVAHRVKMQIIIHEIRAEQISSNFGDQRPAIGARFALLETQVEATSGGGRGSRSICHVCPDFSRVTKAVVKAVWASLQNSTRSATEIHPPIRRMGLPGRIALVMYPIDSQVCPVPRFVQGLFFFCFFLFFPFYSFARFWQNLTLF